MITNEKQLKAVHTFLNSLIPSNKSGDRTRVEECKVLYNSDMPNCIIVKTRIMGYRDGNEIDELRFFCFDENGEQKDIREIITDPNARWSFYYHCKEVYIDGGMLKAKK
jgi:hypothetical protein